MEKIINTRIILKTLVLWIAWVIITFSLSHAVEFPWRFIRRMIPLIFGFLLIIVVNVHYLLPKFYFKKKHIFYTIGAVFLLAGVVIFMHYDGFPWAEFFNGHAQVNVLRRTPREGMARIGMRQITPLIFAFLGSTIFEITRYANLAEKEKLATELKFLKSQINPHFLFNALNNIYSLSVVNAPQTSESIMSLSEILRYMVYDSNETLVPIKSEINYIKSFVELHLLKDSRGMNVRVDLNKVDPTIKVAPLMFIPFVENAFKHSKIENLKEGFIDIALKSEGKSIVFRSVNSVPENSFTKDDIGGVGLENVKKRLQLIYPDDQHQLQINQTLDQFEVQLRIETK